MSHFDRYMPFKKGHKGIYYPRSKEGEARRAASMPKGSDHWNFDPRPSVYAIHRWMYRIHGKATKCEGKKCTGKSKNFDWALIRGKKYIRDRKVFKQLCRSCHVTYDMTVEKRKKIGIKAKETWAKRNKLRP